VRRTDLNHYSAYYRNITLTKKEDMGAKIYKEYRSIALKPFAEKLQSEYYDSIEASSAITKKQCDKIKNMEISEAPLQYVKLCELVISEIAKHVYNRKQIYIPYVHKLSEKIKDNHDCTNCSGSCKINHNMHILDLNATNEEMSKVLSKLQIATLPLYSETMFPDEYRLLRSNMTMLETNLTELFFLESNYLIPKIAEAQKTINADNR
jgi:hypothetical protein